MDLESVQNRNGQTPQARSGQERTAALADARRHAQQAHLQSAQEAETRQSEQFAKASEAVQRALGANTRLSIARNEAAGIFVYRAIDRDTGEVIQEWPPEQFVRLVEALNAEMRQEIAEEVLGAIYDASV